jgi:hypothetical protein
MFFNVRRTALSACSAAFPSARAPAASGSTSPSIFEAEWICPAHWGMVSPRRKRLLRVIRRRIRINPDKVSLRPIGERVWAQAKAEAIEIATGIRGTRPVPPPPAGPPPPAARAAARKIFV